MVLPYTIKDGRTTLSKTESQRVSDQNPSYFKFFFVFIFAYAGGFSHGTTLSGPRRTNCECKDSSARKAGSLVDDYEPKGMIKPFERTPATEFLPGHNETDTYTFFHHYISLFGKEGLNPPIDFKNFPLLHIWPNYFEAYHNHWQRYRGKRVVFMEIGVQSGGKIAMLREYFGPGLTYVGIDINPSCKMFESDEWVHIEIGDSGDRGFLESIKKKYPKVDIFLDDGGHAMDQQRLSMEVMLPHVAFDGVYACEDLNTSWNSLSKYGGKRMADYRDEYFRENTMLGLIHRSIDWLHYGWVSGRTRKMDGPEMFDGFWPETWWKDFALSVKHIHIYNQIVFYEKGQVEIFPTKTIGYQLPIIESGEHDKVNWDEISSQISGYTKSEHQWN
ncbi:hypothetical protein ACA910_021549 [Epithemia clementina (nom. ined.)]